MVKQRPLVFGISALLNPTLISLEYYGIDLNNFCITEINKDW